MKILHIIAEFTREFNERKFRYLQKRDQRKVIFDSKRLESIKDFHFTEEQKQAIDKFYLANYGKKIDHTCHRTYAAYSGKFTPSFISEEIFIPEIGHFLNLFHNYNEVYADKNVIPHIAKSIEVKTPTTLFYCIKGFYLDNNNNPTTLNNIVKSLHNYGRLFIKASVDTYGGKSCVLAEIKDGIDIYTQTPLNQLLKEVGSDFIIQECVECHESIKKIFPKSVNTFRIFTYRWKDNIYLAPSVLRLGRGDMQVDNATQGGLFIGVHENGTLYDFAMTKYGEKYDKHPDTNLIFGKHHISLFTKVTETAIKLHNALPQIGIANWDLTIDECGNVVLIEGNFRAGTPRLLQMATGLSPFGEHTAEILQWVQKMKKIKPSQRYQHAFGY